MNKGTCKNCGYDYGLHHYLTLQCPFGGEAKPGRKQEYMATTFEPETNELAALRAENAELRKALENCVWAIEEKSEGTVAVIFARALLEKS